MSNKKILNSNCDVVFLPESTRAFKRGKIYMCTGAKFNPDTGRTFFKVFSTEDNRTHVMGNENFRTIGHNSHSQPNFLCPACFATYHDDFTYVVISHSGRDAEHSTRIAYVGDSYGLAFQHAKYGGFFLMDNNRFNMLEFWFEGERVSEKYFDIEV